MTKVSNYDLFDYDYENYWKERSYEHKAEEHLLNNILKEQSGKWCLDIGGSYGRLATTYTKKFEHCVILDYSLKTLQKNNKVLAQKYPNVELIAANAYYMPFTRNSFDMAIMVRVLHHIIEPDKYYKDLYRVLNNNATYIQEFANKINIKARFRALLHLNFGIFSQSPYQQPTNSNFEGTKTGEQTIFMNFHPQYVRKELELNSFKIISKHGCSFLRSRLLKKVFKEQTILKIEYFLQKLLAASNIPPSIVYKAQAVKKDQSQGNRDELRSILVCPKCHGKLEFSSNKAFCPHCKVSYEKKQSIWDFRVD